MTKGHSRKKFGKKLSQHDSWSTKRKQQRKNSSHRKKNAVHTEIRKKFVSHKYWRRPDLRAAVLAWTNYKADTVIGTELRLQLQIRDAAGAPMKTPITARPIWSVAGRKLSDTEVYKITEDICGYSPGDVLFPEHLTREEALFFIEVTEMI